MPEERLRLSSVRTRAGGHAYIEGQRSEGRELVKTAASMATATDRKFDLLSLGTFVVLGLPDGMLGTAWPAMRHSFGEPVGVLGLILLVSTIGSVVVATFVGRLIQWIGAVAVLAVADCSTCCTASTALAPRSGRSWSLARFTGAIIVGSWRPAYFVLAALNVVAAAVRIGLALPARPVPAQTVIGPGLLAAIVASGLIRWQPERVVTVLGFVVLGAALAGVFPALIAVTPQRIDEGRASTRSPGRSAPRPPAVPGSPPPSGY
jgi:hypothetical protein